MIECQQEKTKISPPADRGVAAERLPYRIELWDAAKQESIERVLARALNATLARAIFKAAQTEHPGRRITLRRGARIVADSSE